MALQIPKLTSPFGFEVDNAVGLNSGVYVEPLSGNGRCVLDVYCNPEAVSTKPPVKQYSITFGQVLVPADEKNGVEEVRVKTEAEFMADPEFAAAWTTVGAKLYAEWKKHPDLKDATVVNDV